MKRITQEQMFVVSKQLPFNIADKEAEKYFRSEFNYHCANNNDYLSKFEYPQYRERMETHWVFVGNKNRGI